MGNAFSINEIVRFAIEIEKEGIVFYDTMAKQTKNDDLKELYDNFSKDEKVHQAIYEALLKSLPDNEETLNLEDDYVSYLRAMIENSVFDKKTIDEKAKEFNSDLEVLDYAISKEKESMDYYKNMKELVQANNHAEIDKIIQEEQTHVIKLLDQKEKVA